MRRLWPSSCCCGDQYHWSTLVDPHSIGRHEHHARLCIVQTLLVAQALTREHPPLTCAFQVPEVTLVIGFWEGLSNSLSLHRSRCPSNTFPALLYHYISI